MAQPKTSQDENLDGSDAPTSCGRGVSAVRLQRAVLKLAFSFYGRSPELDERLQRLGSFIKAGRRDSAVQALIDEVVDLLIARESAGADGYDTAAHQLAELLGRLTLEGPLGEEARAIQRRLRRTHSKQEFDRQFGEVVDLFSVLARSSTPDDDTELRESTWFDGFLAELQVPPELDEAMNIVRQRLRRQRSQTLLLECARDVARMLTSRLRELPTSAAPDVLAAAVALARAQLQSMVDQLVLPTAIAKETLHVKAQLDGARTEHDIHLAVSSILDLLNQARGCSQREIDDLAVFLRSVTHRLEDFKLQVARSSALHDESISSTDLFQRAMSTQFAGLREHVDRENDLSTLKRIMLEQLESLENSVQHFVDGEQLRQSDADSTLQRMLSRLTELETEAQRLRSDLDAQHTLSLLDPLTSVFNRLGYGEGMTREYARWRRYGSKLSLLLFDLDLFKSINDAYGHATGDKVLVSVAQLVRKQIRECDIQCRIGGEEFAVILPETDVHSAARVAEKLRTSVSHSQFRFKEQPVPVTISIGVAEFRGDDTPEDVFERADRALYLAKKRGRNCYCTELELEDTSNAELQVIEADPARSEVKLIG